MLLLVVFLTLDISQIEQEFYYTSLLDIGLMFLKILIIRLSLTRLFGRICEHRLVCPINIQGTF